MVIDGDVVYVTDSSNHRIVVFKTDGTFVKNLCARGSGLGELRFPYGLDEDEEGHLLVCEFGNNRIQMIDKQTGKGIKTWGVAGREVGQLAYPWAIAVDGERAVIVDSGNNRLQVVDLDWTGKAPARDMGEDVNTVAVNR
jgi:DNA-binding beta-propeller fold protein YncE